MWVSGPSTEVWTGSEEVVRAAQALADKINAVDPAAFGTSPPDANQDDTPRLLSKEGNVGIVSIQGQLFASAPEFAKLFFGITDYGDISAALVAAAKDPSIGSILLDVDSPGGAVRGIDGVTSLIGRINKDVKPVHAIAGGTMASAAYWISSGARRITSGPLSTVGSIGVIQIHQEATKMEEKAGITTTVLRAGKYKALGNPYEPLSETARDEMQSKLDYTYGMFLGQVAQARGLSDAAADKAFGQGRTFIGEQALAVGLVDAIGSYEDALTAAQETAQRTVDSRKSLIHNPKKQEGLADMRKKATLTDADVAAIAAGAPVEQIAASETTTDAPAAEAEPKVEAPVDAPAAAAADADPAPAAAAPADQSAVVALLKEQLAAAQADVLAANLGKVNAEAALAAMQAQLEPLVAIARDTVTKLHIALGSSGAHVPSLDVKALLTEHASASATFKDRFKVGGVAAASAQAEPASKASVASPADKARIKAVRLA